MNYPKQNYPKNRKINHKNGVLNKCVRIIKCTATMGLSTAFVLPSSYLSTVGVVSAAEYKENGRDGSVTGEAQAFDEFLKKCTELERIMLMQSMNALPKIDKSAFGKLSVAVEGVNVKLLNFDEYADDKDSSEKSGRAIRPKTYNEIPAILVARAEKEGFLKNTWTIRDIKETLVWEANHWALYPFKDKNEVDYRKVLNWLADDNDVVGKYSLSAEKLAQKSTYELSEWIAERFLQKRFEDMWGELKGPEERKKVLLELAEKQGVTLTERQQHMIVNWDEEGVVSSEDKQQFLNDLAGRTGSISGAQIAGLATGSGGVALAALGISVTTSGFAFYTSMTTAMAVVASSVGVTLSFSTYTSTTTTVAVLGGPVGWCVAGGMLLVTPFFFGWADEIASANFVTTKYLIEKQMREDGRRENGERRGSWFGW